MLVAIILLAAILLFFVFLKRKGCRMIDAVVFASVGVGVAILVSIESLSAVALINTRMTLLWWAALAMVLLIYLSVNRSQLMTGHSKRLVSEFRTLGRDEKIYLLYIVLLLSITAAIAWLAPPNTFDSMTYHMSRVMHWVQNQSIDFYPTTILRQLLSAPWAEYAILQTVLLTGTDRLANFVQWFCMLGSIGVAAGIARELGANRYGQVFAALFCATLPMGILQSTSTQNDYVVGFWLACFAFQTLKFYRTQQMFDAVALGLALGLAVLTKPTAYIYAIPFVLWIVFDTLYRAGLKPTAKLMACLSLVLVVNAGHFYRNYEFSGAPLGQTLESGDYSYENAVFGPDVLVSNVLRNLGLHLETGTRLDRLLQRSIERAHDLIDISVRDKRTTWPEYEFRVQGQKHHEDYAGNFWQTLLIIATVFFYFLFLKKNPQVSVYILSLLLAFLIFCALLRWQPWHSRLQLPLFILWAPAVGFFMGQLRTLQIKDLISVQMPLLAQASRFFGQGINAIQQIKICTVAGLILIVASLPSVYLSETKPLIGEQSIFLLPREKQLFYGAPHMTDSYLTAANLIEKAGCNKIGLYGFSNDWEYPFWTLVRPTDDAVIQIRHVTAALVSPVGKSLFAGTMTKNFEPCSLVSPAAVTQQNLTINGRNYKETLSSKAIKLFQ
jgi:4-amino-4-deoxy-L-arabinose transferase-like glycosyltransferase